MSGRPNGDCIRVNHITSAVSPTETAPLRGTRCAGATRARPQGVPIAGNAMAIEIKSSAVNAQEQPPGAEVSRPNTYKQTESTTRFRPV